MTKLLTAKSIFIIKMRPLLTTLIFLTLTRSLLANEEIPLGGNKTDKEGNNVLPALKILPTGSTLSNVRVPRFTADYQPASLLTADSLSIISSSEVLGKNVSLNLYRDGAPHINTHLDSITYRHKSNIISSTSPITLTSKDFSIQAHGILLDWDLRAGFLLGKARTTFYSDSATTMSSHPKSQPTTPLSSSSKSLVTATALALTAMPPALTAAELDAINRQAAPLTSSHSEFHNTAQNESERMSALSSRIDKEKAALSTRLNFSTHTIQNEQPLPPAPQAETPIFITINCNGGMYFDAAKGIMVYSKNISITHPQYKLTCDDELKITLKEKKEKKEKPAGKSDATKQADEKKSNSAMKFNDIDTAIATGNVVVTGKDSSGKLIKATAQIATYNHSSGVIILKGGNPSILHDTNIARVLSDNGYIMIMPNMSVRIEGKHEIKAHVPKQKKNKKNEPAPLHD